MKKLLKYMRKETGKQHSIKYIEAIVQQHVRSRRCNEDAVPRRAAIDETKSIKHVLNLKHIGNSDSLMYARIPIKRTSELRNLSNIEM